MIEILHSFTSDGPDGQPWPPSESDALWAVVRRFDGRTLWRAIQLKSDPMPRFVCAYRFEQQRKCCSPNGCRYVSSHPTRNALRCAERGEVRCLKSMISTVCMARNT